MIEQRINDLIEKRNKKIKELESLRSQREKRVLYVSAEAHETGDVSLENAIKLLEKNVASIDEVIAMSKALLTVSSDRVCLGTTFDFSLDNGYSKTVTLVNKIVTDDKICFITDKSPLGAAVIGKAEGEIFSYMTPAGFELNGVINKIYQKEAKQKTI